MKIKIIIGALVLITFAILFNRFEARFLGVPVLQYFSETHPCGAEIHRFCGEIKFREGNPDSVWEVISCLGRSLGSDEETHKGTLGCDKFREQKAAQYHSIPGSCQEERFKYCPHDGASLSCLKNNLSKLGSGCKNNLLEFLDVNSK